MIEPPLYQTHVAAGAEFTDFGGWTMPVAYDSIHKEHQAVRDSVGIFDVSHMGEIEVFGPDAMELMNRLTSNDVRRLAPGNAQYSCILNDDGIIIDDTVIYRYPEKERYLFVPNAGQAKQLEERWAKTAWELGLNVSIHNTTEDTGLVAVQGPDAAQIVESVSRTSITDLSKFSAVQTKIGCVNCFIARTGYTGEDGFEIFFPAPEASHVWSCFDDVQPCGLGARDTLRIEAGYLLSGQEFHPTENPRTPLEAKLGFVVDFTKPTFIGQRALQSHKASGQDEILAGFKVESGAGIPRHNYNILYDGDQIGTVTSGTMSPTYGIPLAVGYIETTYATPGTKLEIKIRDRSVAATVVNHRFLDTLETN